MLSGFLRRLSYRSDIESYRSNIELFNGRVIRGWVTNLRDSGSPSLVAAFRGGKAVSPFVTTVARDDLAALGYGAAAFTLVLTEAPGDGIDIVVINPADRGKST